MSEDEAIALAAKREMHKGRSLLHKRWAAQHSSVKGWHVALVDNHAHIIPAEREKMRRAILARDADAFLDAASALLLARCAAEITTTPARNTSQIGEG